MGAGNGAADRPRGRAHATATRARELRLADRLAAARRRHFVGRSAELELFRSACRARELPFALLYIFGPGGIGKTTLLRELARVGKSERLAVAALDGRAISPAPHDFLLALRRSLGIGEQDSPIDALGAVARSALIVDTFDGLVPLHGWFSESFLPQLPAGCLVVLAGREPPAWRTGWDGLMRVQSLRNLQPEDSRSFLRARGVPRAHHQGALEFTHGHPLALSLVADVLAQRDPGAAFTPANQPDVVRTLLDHFVENLPGPRHRVALEAAAHVRVTTEDLLARAVGIDDAHELFEWLRGLSFMEQGPHGLFPHDLVRDLVDADLRWRNPESYRALHRRSRDYIIHRLSESHGLEQQRAFFDLLDLHRNNPVMKPLYQWKVLGSLYGETAAPRDREAILDMVRRHEGKASQRIAGYWLDRQPQAFTVFRGQEPVPAGFVALISLDQAGLDDSGGDPAIEAARAFIERRGPLRPGEQILHGRYWISREHYHDACPEFDMVAAISTARWITMPRLAWAFTNVSNPDHWQPMFTYLNVMRSPEADFEVGGRRMGVFAHDWRVESPAAWLEGLGEREIQRELTHETRPAAAAPLLVLSRPEFGEAVRRALRDLAHPDALAANPLVRSRLVLERAAGRGPAETLRELIADAAERLKATPRDEKFHRALSITYLRPAPTQEVAAARLNLPFGTYRYQLGIAIERVTGWLWECELAGSTTGS